MRNRRLYRAPLFIDSSHWLEMLDHRSVFAEEDVRLIEALYLCGERGERAAVLAERLGVNGFGVLNLQIGRLGKRIMAYLPDVSYEQLEDHGKM